MFSILFVVGCACKGGLARTLHEPRECGLPELLYSDVCPLLAHSPDPIFGSEVKLADCVEGCVTRGFALFFSQEVAYVASVLLRVFN